VINLVFSSLRDEFRAQPLSPTRAVMFLQACHI
jgi:hypothetical protein